MGKRSVEWYTAKENVTAPSHIRAYIESCKDWLLAQPDEYEDVDDKMAKQAAPVILDSQKIGNIGIPRNSIHQDNVFECFVCGEHSRVQSGRVMNANPFTRSQSMLLCTACATAVK